MDKKISAAKRLNPAPELTDGTHFDALGQEVFRVQKNLFNEIYGTSRNAALIVFSMTKHYAKKHIDNLTMKPEAKYEELIERYHTLAPLAEGIHKQGLQDYNNRSNEAEDYIRDNSPDHKEAYIRAATFQGLAAGYPDYQESYLDFQYLAVKLPYQLQDVEHLIQELKALLDEPKREADRKTSFRQSYMQCANILQDILGTTHCYLWTQHQFHILARDILGRKIIYSDKIAEEMTI